MKIEVEVKHQKRGWIATDLLVHPSVDPLIGFGTRQQVAQDIKTHVLKMMDAPPQHDPIVDEF